MGSTDLITYLNYMSTWDGETDANIDAIISEQNMFLNLGDFDSDTAVNKEFGTLYDLACEVRNRTIAADVTQIAADAAAIGAIWSFGLGMAAFAVLEATEMIEQKVISSKSAELNAKLTTVDTDISAQINSKVKDYIAKYKQNNNLIASKAAAGLDTRTCRGLLLQFLAQVQRTTALDAASFRTYAESARTVYNSAEIDSVYDALDTLNFSGKTDSDVAKFMGVLAGLSYPKTELGMVRSACIAIMFFKLGIAHNTIKVQAEAAGLPIEEVEASAFMTMDAVGKFVTVIAVVMSVVDAVFEILDIVAVVEQCETMCTELNGPIKTSYLAYFNGIKTAADEYKKAIGYVPPTPPAPPTPSGGVSAGNDIAQMQSQIAQYGSITQFGVRISSITGSVTDPNQASGTVTKTDGGFAGYNGTWQIGNWGDTLQLTR